MKHITNMAFAVSFMTIVILTGCTQNPEIPSQSSQQTDVTTQILNETVNTASNAQTAKMQKPVLKGPTESVLSKDGKTANVVFSWTGNAEHYDLMIRNGNDDGISYVKANIKTATTTESFLPSEKPYTWWVRAYASDDSPEDFIDSEFGQFSVYQQSKENNPITKTTAFILPAELISPAEGSMDSPNKCNFNF